MHHPTCRRVDAGGNWSQQAKLTSDSPKISGFGFALSLKTSALVIGAHNSVVSGNASQGAALLFSRTGNTWNKQTEFMIFDGALQDRFGNSVVQDGSLIIVGTLQKNVNLHNQPDASQHGNVYVFSILPDDGLPKILGVQVKGKKLLVTGTSSPLHLR